MDTETVRLNVTLPRDLVNSLNKHAGPRKKSQYIAKALRNQIELDRKQSLENALEEGYRSRRQESQMLGEAFEAVDLEGWDEY